LVEGRIALLAKRQTQFRAFLMHQPRSAPSFPNIVRGVMYQSKNSTANPCVSKATDSGTLSSI
jgi:hypothetical protein